MLKVQHFVFNQFAENTFLVYDEKNKHALIIDPGCSNDYEFNELKEFISQKNLIVKYLVNTHCHIDHILGNKIVKDNYNCQFLCGEEDEFLLDLMYEQAGNYGFQMEKSPKPEAYLTEQTVLEDFDVKFLHTPGHSPGEYCLFFYNDNFLIAGDVLFLEGIGRTDLWGGNYDTLISSIRNKIFTLDDEVIVYSGHGNITTIGHEKRNNPFL